MVHRSIGCFATAALLGSVSFIGFETPALASHVLFSTDQALSGKELAPEIEVIVQNGITQVVLANNAVAAFVDGAQFSVRPDGGISLRSGTATVVSPSGGAVSVYMPDGVMGSIDGENASASFTVTANCTRGSVLGGKVVVLANGVTRNYGPKSFWTAAKDHAPEQVTASAPAAVPGSVRRTREGGIAAAAENGFPTALGEALAAVGANGDIVTAARRIEAYDRNPSLTAFPRGDYGLLTAYASQAASPFGGAAFNGAAADIVRTYFQFLASGRQPGDFRAAYAQSLLGYLDLLRSGALPSGFAGATQAQLSAYIAFIGRTDGFGTLSATNRNLLDAYLAFLSGGGTPDGFGNRASTLSGAYLDYLRAGGNPANFAVASASVIAQYLAILQSGGIKNQLTLANQALLDAYLASVARFGNGLAFADTAATSLAAFTAYLTSDGFPSQYTAADAATVRTYLETLDATGLFDRVLGNQAVFLRSYLVFLRSGGTADAFEKLPINVLTAQANALGSYYAFIQSGGTPSTYTTLTQNQVNAYLKALKDGGLFDALLGNNARFLSDYYAYILQGGNADLYAGLPNVDLNAYAGQVATYVAYLKSGRLPSAYTVLSLQQLRDYLNALSASGRLATLLGSDASFLASYLAYVQGGGVPDQFTGLPIYTYAAYSTQLSAFVAFLNAGGLPSTYTALTAAQIRAFLETLQANDQLVALLGANANFFATYLAYLQGGGSSDAFAGLPIATYRTYSAALTAFYAYLAGGGQPSGYTTLTQAEILAYLQALIAAGQVNALLGGNADFFASYYTYINGGGSPDAYAGLPTTQPGTGGMIAATPPPVYRGGFPSATGRVLTAAANGQDFSNALRVYVDPKTGILGQVVESINYFGIGTTTAVDVAGDASVVIGRYTNGTTYGNNGGYIVGATGIPYAVLAPKVGNLPASGTITYSTLAATQPVEFANSGTPGSFLGQLSITFGTTSTYFITGSLTLPEPGGTNRYGFASANNASFNPRFPRFSAALTGTGAACASTSCRIGFFGDFAGSTPASRLGLIYLTSDPATPTAAVIKGAVIFGADGTFTPEVIAPPAAAGAPTGNGLRYSNGGFDHAVNIVADANGNLASLNGTYLRGTATDHENGGLAGIIGWTRWSGGSPQGPGEGTAAIPANGGIGRIWGAPATAVPTAGVATYDLAGATAVVAANGALAPGAIQTANLSVDFSQRKVGFASTFVLGGVNYTIGSAGGIAAPAMPLGVNNEFYSTAPGLGELVTVGGNGCNPSTCPAGAVGFLAGPGAGYAGLTFNFYSPDAAGFAGAAIAFGKRP